jgi:hypothetical protein
MYAVFGVFALIVVVLYVADVLVGPQGAVLDESPRGSPDLDRIRATQDLTPFHHIRDESGEVVAVRAVRAAFPGISLTDAVDLVRH